VEIIVKFGSSFPEFNRTKSSHDIIYMGHGSLDYSFFVSKQACSIALRAGGDHCMATP
jgi:hypothetical protein